MKFVYRYGKQFTIDKILLSAAIDGVQIPTLNSILREIEDTVVPIFPLRGRDLIGRIGNGEHVGRVLNALEQQWIDSGFRLTRDELLRAL